MKNAIPAHWELPKSSHLSVSTYLRFPQVSESQTLRVSVSPSVRVSVSTFLQVDNSTFLLVEFSTFPPEYNNVFLQLCTFVFLHKYNNTFLYCCIFALLYFCISTVIHPFEKETPVINHPISKNFPRNFRWRNCPVVFRS